MLKKPINIILINDNKQLCSDIVDNAAQHRFLIKSFYNLEEGIQYLESEHKIRAVVLDSQCFLDDDQKQSSLKTNFVFHAMEQINRIEQGQNRYIPFVVYAEELFDLEKDLDGIAKVIAKSNDGHKPLFHHLDEIVASLPEIIVREKHTTIFEFLENYFSNDDDDLMETLLMQSEKSDTSSVIINMTLIRRLLEKLFDVLAVNMLGKAPEKFKQRGRGRTRSIIEAMVQQKSLPYELEKVAGNLYYFSSKFGNHNQVGRDHDYFPHRHAVIANINYLLELFLWASNALESLPE